MWTLCKTLTSKSITLIPLKFLKFLPTLSLEKISRPEFKDPISGRKLDLFPQTDS